MTGISLLCTNCFCKVKSSNLHQLLFLDPKNLEFLIFLVFSALLYHYCLKKAPLNSNAWCNCISIKFTIKNHLKILTNRQECIFAQNLFDKVIVKQSWCSYYFHSLMMTHLRMIKLSQYFNLIDSKFIPNFIIFSIDFLKHFMTIIAAKNFWLYYQNTSLKSLFAIVQY